MNESAQRIRNRKRRIRQKRTKADPDSSGTVVDVIHFIAICGTLYVACRLVYAIVSSCYGHVLLAENNVLTAARVVSNYTVFMRRSKDYVKYEYVVDGKEYYEKTSDTYYTNNMERFDVITVRYNPDKPKICYTSVFFYKLQQRWSRRDARWTRMMNAMIEDHVPQPERDKFLLKE